MKYTLSVFILLLVFLSSCHDDPQVYRISEDSLDWFPEQRKNPFKMVSGSDTLAFEYEFFAKGFYEVYKWHGKTIKYSIEENTLGYISSVSHIPDIGTFSYAITIKAGEDNKGDLFKIRLHNSTSTLNLVFYQNTPENLGYNYYTDSTGYDHALNSGAYSTLEFLDTLTINSTLYTDIMHLSFQDAWHLWNDGTVKDVYFAKGIGMIRFSIDAGNVYDRIPLI